MNHRITPLTYLTELLATWLRHGGELAVGLVGVVVIGLTALTMRSLLHVQAFGGPGHVLLVLLPLIAAVLLFQAAVAAWRLYHRQQITLAATRSLLDLNVTDRADLEQRLRTRYRRREARIQERNGARLERMAGEIAALQSEVMGRSHRRAAPLQQFL
jgi:hypothetical protein